MAVPFSSSRGTRPPTSFNIWPPTCHPGVTPSRKWPRTYRLRWQVELLFKEWKSFANLHAFDTQNPAIVEGLIWAAIGAAALKRFLAHTAQVVAGVETSTRKAAMCAVHVLQDILRTLISGIARAIDYLAGNARRAHPKRDRQRGRLQFGRIDTKTETVEALTFQDTYAYREVYPDGSAVDLKAKRS
jgi:hypothetical protein